MMGEQRHRAYGKGARVLLADLAACRDVVIWAIDLRPGAELRPRAPCPGRLATTPAEAAALLADAVTIVFARAQHLAGHGKREWQPSPARPALVIIINEYAELAGDAPDAMSDTGTIARLGRAAAVILVAAIRRPAQKVMGQGVVRSQMNIGSRSAPENNATLTSSSDTARSRPAGAPVSSAPPERSSSPLRSTTPTAAPAPASSPATT